MSLNTFMYLKSEHRTTYTNHILEIREMWDVPGVVGSARAPQYPKEVPQLQTSMESLTYECRDLLRKLLRAVAKALRLEDEEYLLKIHQNVEDDKMFSKSTIRCLYYPPLPDDEVIPSNGIRCREVLKNMSSCFHDGLTMHFNFHLLDSINHNNNALCLVIKSSSHILMKILCSAQNSKNMQ